MKKEESINTNLPPEKRSSLSPEHIAHMLKVLGADVIEDMMVEAGLDPSIDVSELIDSDVEDLKKARQEWKKTSVAPRKSSFARRFFLLFIFIGIVLIFLAINMISMMVTINSNAPIQYSEATDNISCVDGTLIVNKARVTVPTDGSEEYRITYAWGEEDEKYPSVPHAITVTYPDKEGGTAYSLSLYRNETILKDAIPSGKTADNWFDDWNVTPEEGINQSPLKTEKVNGFYISPTSPVEADEVNQEYSNYSYYFAVQEDLGVSIYVLEGIPLSEEGGKQLASIMDTCINSIRIK